MYTQPKLSLLLSVLWMVLIPTVTPLLPRPLTGCEWPAGKEVDAYTLPSMYSSVKVTERDLQDAVDFAKLVINMMKTREQNLLAAQIGIHNGTPSHGNFIAYGPDSEAVRRGKIGHIALKASTRLVTKACGGLTYDWTDCAIFVNKFNFKNTALGDLCTDMKRRCSPEEINYMYRSADGRCNNELSASKGESFTGFQRLLEPNYITLSYTRRAQNKKPLPPPRSLSIGLVNFAQNPHERYTMAVTQWGEFVEHDMSRLAVSVMFHSAHDIDCCQSSGRSLSPRHVHPFCTPIHPPSNDTYYNNLNFHCMSYVRSIPVMRADCSFGNPEQMNQATHFIDGSQIYGSTFDKTAYLRQYKGGRLNTSTFESRSFLPKSPNPTADCQVRSENSPCFLSGDPRVNMQPGTTAMYTLWMREHNRIARELATLNPRWDDETVFQETRRIVIAEMQHITYKEWLPLTLGSNYIKKINLNAKYNPKTDPSVSNSFASAAIRALTSLHSGTISLYDETREKKSQYLEISKYFNKPGVILQKGKLDGIIRGFTTQASEQIDMSFAEDMINKLYSDGEIGYDVLSLDLEKGRDHGLPGYSKFRSLCGLLRPNDIHDLVDTMTPENVEALQSMYNHHLDIDLIVGGMMESPVPMSLFGPTFSCIIADQFLRTRQGDRYFYTNTKQPRPFTDDQLNEIRKVTFSRILCDNADNIRTMQRSVFEKISNSNPLVSCDSDDIPRINFLPWHESRERYYH